VAAEVLPFDDPISPDELAEMFRNVSASEGDSASDAARLAGLHENTVLRWRQAKGLESTSHFLRYFEARGYIVRISKARA